WGTADQLMVFALDHDGNSLWSRDMGPVSGGHGFGASPILSHGKVVLNNDQEKGGGNLFALDAATGETAWTVERRSQRISYSVPCEYQDTLTFVNWQHGFTAIEPNTGKVIADKSVFNTDTNERAISSPISVGDLVIGTCGFTTNPKHCIAMKLVAGEWQEVWRIERNVPHIPCLLALDDLLYLWDDSGILTCVESATGKEKYKARLPGAEGTFFGSPVSDGTHLFCADESGNVHVIRHGDTFQPVAVNPTGSPCKSTPAIIDGTLYLRVEGKLIAIGSKK
ncbi:MAG: PQQ-binding-like beta-propeller repeat protein, partial [Verrucomicrobiota bacterium]